MQLQQASGRSCFLVHFASKKLARQSHNDGVLSKPTLIVHQNVGPRWSCGQPQEVWIPNKEVDITKIKRTLNEKTRGIEKIRVLEAFNLLKHCRTGNPYKALQVVCDDKTLGWFVPAPLLFPNIEDQLIEQNKANMIKNLVI